MSLPFHEGVMKLKVKDTKVQDVFVQSKVSHRMQHMLQHMSSVYVGTRAVYCTTSEQNTDITRVSNMRLTVPRMLSVFFAAVCLNISVCGFHKYNHGNHHSAVIHKNNCTPFPLSPSSQKNYLEAMLYSTELCLACSVYLLPFIYRPPVGR